MVATQFGVARCGVEASEGERLDARPKKSSAKKVFSLAATRESGREASGGAGTCDPAAPHKFRHAVTMAPRSFPRWLLALAALFCVASTASAAVLGIDYGSEYVKVSIVAPGRTPISIVINEISKRKSTAAVAFTGGDRWLAEEAMNYNARFPDRVFTRLRDLLGKETAVDSFTQYLDRYKLPFKVTADAERATARIVTESGEAYLVEELVAMILQYAMKIGEGMGKGQIKVRRSRPLSATGTPRATRRGDRTKRRKRAIERPSFVDVLFFRTRRACVT